MRLKKQSLVQHSCFLTLLQKLESWPPARSNKTQLCRLIGQRFLKVWITPSSGLQPTSVWRWRTRGPQTQSALTGTIPARNNEITSTETLNGFKAGFSRLPLLSKQRPSFGRTNWWCRVVDDLSTARNRGFFSIMTTQRNAGLRVLHSITRHSHWKRRVFKGPAWCSFGSMLCTQMKSIFQTDGL